MRRFLTAVLFLFLTVSLVGCSGHTVCRHEWERTENLNRYTAQERCRICGAERTYTDAERGSYSGPETEISIKYIHPFWRTISEKAIPECALNYAILDCLSSLEETGERVPGLGPDYFPDGVILLPSVAGGTFWLDCGSVGLFRISPELDSICKVKTPMGDGKTIKMTDTLSALIRQAWDYYPWDYWEGVYENGRVSLQQVYRSDSVVEALGVAEIQTENEQHQENSITLAILAKEDANVTVSLISQHSDDYIGSSYERELQLKKGRETYVKLPFSEFKISYYLTIRVDNSLVIIRIRS